MSFLLFFKNTIKNTKNFFKLFVIFQKYLHIYAQTHINTKKKNAKKRKRKKSTYKSRKGIKKYIWYKKV